MCEYIYMYSGDIGNKVPIIESGCRQTKSINKLYLKN